MSTVVINSYSYASLDADYSTYKAAMSTPPGATWETAVNTLFVDLKAALGVSALSDAWDVAYFLAAETEQAALLNMVKRANDATNTGSATFTASQGFTGNGSSMYIDTNFNGSTQGVNYVLDSASLGVYARTTGNTGVDIGSINADTTQRTFVQRTTATLLGHSVHQGASRNSTIATYTGLMCADRDGAASIVGYRNGSSVGTFSDSSTGIPSLNYLILARNNNGTPDTYSTRQLAFCFCGRSMTGTEHGNVYTAIQAAMTAIGANV